MGTYKELFAFQKAFELAMLIYHMTKRFPQDERSGLISQIRRSSRSVCTNIAEAYKRRRYTMYFISKLNDAETENTETEVWIEFSQACGLISDHEKKELKEKNDQIAKLIWFMINNPKKFS